MTCPSCSKPAPEGASFCPACRTPLLALTTADTGGPAPQQANQFTPGTMFANRYRIATLVGRGGMGEVYRADDLKLSQAVALKFLPPRLAKDEQALARFHGEVRTARQISHPNVCRVYDLGESKGRSFLSMEYIDGEDLASLLRRIGRLPPDKALEVAGQLCSGVAAAHQAGIVHRDLKPANVMIDSHGQAHVTDFGLAGLLDELRKQGDAAGTPAYMAPEQLERGEVSIRSDVFSLGLILYEAFTGHRAFPAATRSELLRSYEHSSPVPPSRLVEDMDPLVERAILRCLEHDPAERPASASEVLRVLPGGDPLAAALAAGETPSPAMVAASGGEGALERGPAWMLLGSVIAGIALVVALTQVSSALALAPMPLSPVALSVRAQEIVKKVGYTERPADSSGRFHRNDEFMDNRAKNLASPLAWRTLRDAPQSHQYFIYRQSPVPLASVNPLADVTDEDPPMLFAGMVRAILDSRGSLMNLWVVPPQVAGITPAPSSPDFDWTTLLAETGLDLHRFEPEAPYWNPPMAFDAVAGWKGSYAQEPEVPIHLVAAAFQGRPVYFELIAPWNRPPRQTLLPYSSAHWTDLVNIAILLVSLAACLLLARLNLRLGRGDTSGALRLGCFAFACYTLAYLLNANHLPEASDEWDVLVRIWGVGLLQAFKVWLMYLAIEPFVRKRWPQLLVGWSRVLAGRFRDPLVGRDILCGIAVGVGACINAHVMGSLPAWFDIRGRTPSLCNSLSLGQTNRFLSYLAVETGDSVGKALVTITMLFLALLIGRRRRIAYAITGVVMAVLLITSESWVITGPRSVINAILVVFVSGRFGTLALAFFIFTTTLLTKFPLIPQFSLWYTGRSYLIAGLCLGAAIYAFKTALGGKPAFTAAWLDE
jgi:hypothetical protein